MASNKLDAAAHLLEQVARVSITSCKWRSVNGPENSVDNQGIHSHRSGTFVDNGDRMFARSQAGYFTNCLLGWRAPVVDRSAVARVWPSICTSIFPAPTSFGAMTESCCR